MVNKTSINGKEAHFYNNSTPHCGFKKKLNAWKGLLGRRPIHNTIPYVFIDSYEPYDNSLSKWEGPSSFTSFIMPSFPCHLLILKSIYQGSIGVLLMDCWALSMIPHGFWRIFNKFFFELVLNITFEGSISFKSPQYCP